jgi:hypothetical protein
MGKGEGVKMENLNEMIQQETEQPTKFEEAELQSEEETQGAVEEAQPEGGNTNEISITTLGPWFAEYRDTIPNVHQLQAQIRGVDGNENLIVSVDDPNGEELESGIVKRSLRLFDNAAVQPVLNLPPSDMRVYNNNTFRVLYTLTENTVVKMYGVKTGLIAMFSFAIDGGILPYAKIIAKKRAVSIPIPEGDIAAYTQKLNSPVDLETLQLLYRQSSKANVTFTTVRDAINWLLARQDNITDINHHLEIDKVVMTLLS